MDEHAGDTMHPAGAGDLTRCAVCDGTADNVRAVRQEAFGERHLIVCCRGPAARRTRAAIILGKMTADIP